MRRAVQLAKKGTGRTNPNPLVGAVIVKDGSIVAEGYHHCFGDLHAERDAIRNCNEKNISTRGTELYVTLEPCCHFGKQPPCTRAIVEAGFSKVIVGSRDPNPLVSGKGIEYLRQNGTEVEEDFLKEECDSLNEIFFHYIKNRTPYVALKYAMTLDGKISTKSGESRWISNGKSREHAHSLRNKYSCILAGIGTVVADDPMLDCRIPGGRNPVRVICDSNLSIPFGSKIVKSANHIKTIIAYADNSSAAEEKISKLKSFDVETILCGKGKVDLRKLVRILGERNIDSVLIEGGSEINFSALDCGIVNHVYTYIAPKIFGGNGRSPVSGTGLDKITDSFRFRLKGTSIFDDDILVEYEADE